MRTPGGQFGGNFLPDPMHAGCEVVHCFKFDTIAAVDGIRGFLDGVAQPDELGLVFLLALLQEPEAFSHHLAGVAGSPLPAAGQTP